MTSKRIKIIVICLAIVFVVILIGGNFYNNKNKELLNFQIKINNNFILNNNVTAKLCDETFFPNYISHDNLDFAISKQAEGIQEILEQYPENLKIAETKDIILKQIQTIDLIKKLNFIVKDSLEYLQNFLYNSMFDLYKSENKNLFEQKIMKLISLTYTINSVDNKTLTQYRSCISEIKSLTLKSPKLLEYKKNILTNAEKIFTNLEKIQKKLLLFNQSDDYLSTIYTKIGHDIEKENLKILDYIKYAQIILIIILIIFLYLLIKILKNEQESKDEQAKLQILIDKNIVISKTNLNGIITSVSEAFCLQSGFSEEELIGKSHNIIRSPDMPQTFFKNMWETIHSGEIWKGKVKNCKKNGKYYWEYVVIEPMFDDKKNITSYLSIRTDITDRISLEEMIKNQETIIETQTEIANTQRDAAIKALNVKSEFLANMSHEIRTPLSGILGFVDILKGKMQCEEDKKYLQIIDNSSHHLLNVINDILDFSKIESGKLNIENLDFDIRKEIQNTIDIFKAKCLEKNLDLSLEIDDDLPKFINSDLLKIKQVVSNLLSNALKFTSSGKKVKIKLDYKNDMLSVSIEDEGNGIAKDKLNHIFEVFSQEDDSTTRKYGGTGLGLSISRELVKLLGGELKVESKVGIGSKFYFSIPIVMGKKTINLSEYSVAPNLSGHLLLAEDNATNQEFMKIILSKLGLSFDIANDGIEALEKFKANKYDAILMDENMPNMNGIEATSHIREYEKNNNLVHTPIIALTANALKSDRAKFLNAGMDEYLAKPIDKIRIAEGLSKFLKHKD